MADHRAMPPLRSIAVTVAQDKEGGYRWRLVELGEESWHLVSQQARSAKTYKAAMAAGLVELQRMIEDLDAGPREAAAAEPAEDRKGGPVFGFGFGLPKIG